jgi:hypothetical protein
MRTAPAIAVENEAERLVELVAPKTCAFLGSPKNLKSSDCCPDFVIEDERTEGRTRQAHLRPVKSLKTVCEDFIKQFQGVLM